MLTVLRSRVAHPKLESLQFSRVKCSLCNQLYYRKLGLSTKSAELPINGNCSTAKIGAKKKTSRRKTRFTELLEVGGPSINEINPKLKKLSLKNLKQLEPVIRTASADDVRLSVDVLEDVRDGILGADDSQDHDMIDPKAKHLLNDVSPYSLALAPDSPAVDGSLTTDLSSKSLVKTKYGKSIKEKMSQVDLNELAVAGRDKSLQDSLLSYIELCVNCGFTHRAWMTLSYYVNKSKFNVTNPRIFEILMDGYASGGHYDKLLEVWKLMESVPVEPTVETFASRFEAIARSKERDKAAHLMDTLGLMEKKDLEVNDMFVQKQWVKDSQDVVLKAVNIVRPKFIPVYPPPSLEYTNPLLNHLNNMDSSSLVSPAEGLCTASTLISSFKNQLDHEVGSTIVVKSVEKQPDHDEQTFLYREKLENVMRSWEQCITAALNREISSMNAQHKSFRFSYVQLNLYPYLVVLDKKHYKEIIMQEIRKLAEGSETFSPVSAMLHRSVGHQVRQRYIVKTKKESGMLEKMENMYEQYAEWYMNPRNSQMACNGRQQWQILKHQMRNGPSIDKEIASWPPYVLSGIGRFLYKIILRDIKIDVNIMRPNSSSKHYLPAFYTVYRNQGGPLHEEIKPHPVLSRLYRAACLPQLTFNANDTPSLCPPIPWTSLETGGYIVAKTNLIRLPQQALQQWSRMQTLPKNQMYPCYDSLNQLGSIPWKVNQRVLDTVIKVFNSGGSDKLDIPEPPSLIPYPEKLSNDMSTEEKAELFKKRLIVKRKKAEMYSLWCDALYRLSLANHFKDSIFWLPHNMDFRGRVYPCPPHLNHLGADMPRSLLQFAKGQPLGPKGLDWLKIHAINLTGLKKRNSISDRLEYANEIMDLIIDSAKDPLDGKKWWMESEDPWQTLACCIEISDALDCPDGPENFISHFPVHQDGSCNGLQHYAALGRDSAGAYSVNLAPAPVPQDVYSAVAAIVERIRSEDAANGMEVAQVLEGFVRRKVVKQTVMTTVYGVTKFGARLQIAKQLKDIDDFPKKHVWPASYYLATKTFESLREMFSSTREIQDWFTESARLISMLCGKNVAYLTPLGLPVVQPYVRLPPKTTTNRSKTGGKYVAHRMDSFERPNVMKQKNAFPPNFIHSLDSSHMMLTSLHCEQAGITFVSVHDCFWTHACSIEIMNKICRQQFVALHSQPILADLSKFLFDEFGYNENSLREPLDEKALVAMEKLNNLLRALPHQGDFDLKNVLDSVYFFS
ncbi:Probable Hypothetical protein polymerase III subunit RPC6 [Nesidiocoris tenuis]|uniref:DNA-directed RNA polymerase n=1 Tax=Nesidiocoris tenuis TaxID=355587 RepID=A0ABN7AQ81_9HEMI|nr:Probable Hypothetical protein polymerase III subunit RPC6 [Nesidiocoris tenuis]